MAIVFSFHPDVQNYGVATIVNGGMGDASILLQQQQQPVAVAGRCKQNDLIVAIIRRAVQCHSS
jgi:hypothetical protein